MNFFDTHITPEACREVLNCLLSGHLSEGKRVQVFEEELSELGLRNPVAVNSGTSALHLALKLAGVTDGDEVILPAQTFVATGLAILYRGAIPVFADIGMDGNISFTDAIGKITDKTKAIILVSWGGNPCELGRFSLHCAFKGIKLIQDNAQAFGATLHGQNLSEYGDFSCYSFQAIKHLSTGDGGAVTVPDHLVRQAKRLRWFGIDRELDLPDETGERVYDLKEIGYKYHMNDYEAALGLGNLVGWEKRLKRVREIAKYYDEIIPQITYTPKKKDGCSYWLYDLLVERRSAFIQMMKSKEIPVSVAHVGIDRNTLFGGKSDLKTQRYWDKFHVCVPIHSGLTDEDVEKVVSAIKGGW